MKNYIFIYYTIFLILFNNIFAVVHDLEKDPLPPYVSSALSKASVLVTYNFEFIGYDLEKGLAFLFGKYLFIPKGNYENNKIKSIVKIQKFDFIDNKLNLITYDATLFSFAKTPTEDNHLYVTSIERSPFHLTIRPNYAEYFKSILSKSDFENSLEDDKNEFYLLYFNQDSNIILWEKYSSIQIRSSIVHLISSTIDGIFQSFLPLVGLLTEEFIFLKLPPHTSRGVLVLFKHKTHCYFAKFETNEDLYLGVYFIDTKINHYKPLLTEKKLKID